MLVSAEIDDVVAGSGQDGDGAGGICGQCLDARSGGVEIGIADEAWIPGGETIVLEETVDGADRENIAGAATQPFSSMPEAALIDLSDSETWYGIRPGMRRDEVVETLRRLEVEAEPYSECNLTATADDWEMELYFATDGTDRLRQVSLDGETISWRGNPLQGSRLDDVLKAMEPIGPAMWTTYDAAADPFPEEGQTEQAGVTASAVPDEKLLEEGTLWLAERRLGLVVYDGEVMGVVWREPRDFPQQFAGSLTEAQRQISTREDLTEYIAEKRLERIAAETPPNWQKPWRTAMTVLLIGALAALGRLGWQESARWHQAQTLAAHFINVERVPQKQFRDYVPAGVRWLFPKTPARIVDACRVEYQDPGGVRHETVLEASEFYVPPQQAGDEMPLAYAENPPEVKGLFRARDAAFIRYVPWGIAFGAVYLVALLALSLLPGLWRFARGKGNSVRAV